MVRLTGLLLLWFTMPAWSGAPAIVVFGDSLSAAYGIEQKRGWVALMQNRIQEKGYPQQIINASISGETTRSGLSRIDRVLREHRPKIVIIELGGNDGLRGLPIQELRGNLERLAEKCLNAGAKVLLVGMQLPPNYGARYTQAFANAYQEVAQRFNLTFVPFLLAGLEADFSLYQADGIHPNAAGQPRLLENVWPYLEPLLLSNSR